MEQDDVLPIAARVIEKCGGDKATADLIGVDRSVVTRWRIRKPGGTGGLIPAKHQGRLLARARERGIVLTEADFFAASAHGEAA